MIDVGRLAQLPCFAELSTEDRARVSELVEELEVAAGEEVAVQGDFAYEFFVIEEGTADVRENGVRVAELGRGDFFGELGLLVTGRRTASVVSTSPMKLIGLFDRDFRRLEHELPDFARACVRRATNASGAGEPPARPGSGRGATVTASRTA